MLNELRKGNKNISLKNGTLIKCKICGREFKQHGDLTKHLRCEHQLEPKEYYDKFLKTEQNSTCVICGKLSRFKNLRLGYLKTCCADCTRELNTGYRNNFQNPKFIQKIKNTKIEHEKNDPNYKQSIQDKVKETSRKRFGVDHFSSAPEVKKKRELTNLKNFGATNPFAADNIKEDIRSKLEENYGGSGYASNILKSKIENTNLEKYGAKNPWSSKQVIQKIKETKKKNLQDFCEKNKCVLLKDLDLEYSFRALKEFNIPYIVSNNNAFIEKKYISDLEKANEEVKIQVQEYNSRYEVEIHTWLKSIYSGEILINEYGIIPNRRQLDFYIPEKNLAIEFNGDYIHSINFGKDKNYHLNKTQLCQEKDIRLIHIFEHEWNEKKDICKSIILSTLNIYEKIIYARKCEVKEVSSEEAKYFLSKNHLQGIVASNYRIGLYYEDELVQLLCFGKNRFKKNEIELLRMCTELNTQVIGGFSKLLRHQPYNTFISYVDISKFTANSYLENGFRVLSQSAPNYKYIKGEKALNRLQAQKYKLPKLLGDKFDKNKTESENMISNGWWKVYDCGNLKLEFTK